MIRSAQPRRGRLLITLSVVSGLLLLSVAPVWGSIFGEENSSLVQMVVQLFQIQKQMSDLNRVAGQVADTTSGLLATYQQVNAGINQLKSYSFDAFFNDVTVDLYRQYPGFAKLQYASEGLSQWNNTLVSSPWTAYEAITAVVGDVSQPLRDDIARGHTKIDRELLLKAEAAGGFASAYTAEQVTQKYDNEISALSRLAQNASPGQAAQLSARANLVVAAQQSYVMRLLARAVRLHSVDATLEYGNRIDSRNDAYRQGATAQQFAAAAASSPPLVDFSQEPIEQLLEPYDTPTSTSGPIDPYAGGRP